eukprot:TRINITY_DN32157_c0_g1_i1.p2 TRINITY_DN32157_c0_g1~~TRINITY_DN32157_c0_g1_i1.p2  ORF type:complete len:102 (-),score=7.33 TRINITY_DN32157_c0_g1_i1:127-432(-)
MKRKKEVFKRGGVFFFQAEDGIRDAQESRGLGDVYKRQTSYRMSSNRSGKVWDSKSMSAVDMTPPVKGAIWETGLATRTVATAASPKSEFTMPVPVVSSRM